MGTGSVFLDTYIYCSAVKEQKNKKFQFNKIDKNARSREYTGCIEWLIDAGVIIECQCLVYPELPLKGNVDEGKFKLSFCAFY